MNSRYSVFDVFDLRALQLLQVPLALGLLLAWRQSLIRYSSPGLYFFAFLGFFWCFIVIISNSRDRCSELELALPLSGVQIWKHTVFSSIVKTIAHLAVFMLPVIMICHFFFTEKLLTMAGYVLIGLIFTGALIHRIQPGCNRARDMGQLSGAVGAGLLVTVLLLVIRSPWLPFLVVAAAGLLLLLAGRQVRESLTLVDDRADPRGGYASLGRWEQDTRSQSVAPPAVPNRPAWAGRYLSTIWMLGSANERQHSLVFRIISYLILVNLGGELAAPGVDMSTVIISLLGAGLVLLRLSPEQVGRGSPFAHLPLDRRRLHAGLLLPALAAIVFGMVAQTGLSMAFSTHPGHVRVTQAEFHGEIQYHIHVPSRLHRITWNGRPPRVPGRDGETHSVGSTVTMSYGDTDGPGLYNPFGVDRAPSRAFVVDQYIRAVKAVYDVDLNLEQAERLIDRYQGSLNTVEGLTVTGVPQRTAIGIIIFSVVWSLFTIAVAFLSRWVSPARFARWRRSIQTGAVAGLAMVVIAVVFTIQTSATTIFWLVSVVPVLASQLAARMPGGLVSIGIALLCLAGAWLLSQELFARREVSPGKAEV